MPDFKRMVRSILNLISTKRDGRWDPKCTATLNMIAEQVYHRMQLGWVDMQVGVRKYVDVEGGSYGLVVT